MTAALWRTTLAACFLAPYIVTTDLWWKFFPATALIIYCQYRATPTRWTSDLGLTMTGRELAQALVALGVATWAFRRFLLWLAADLGLESGAALVPTEWRLLPIAQSFNEEMIFRALLLGYVARHLQDRWWLSPVCAGLFAAAHFLFYRYGIQSVTLSATTLTTLFFFGMTANDLFLRYRHIGYTVALHLGWNLTRFGESWMYHDHWLGEAQGFNMIEGDTRAAIGAVALWILVRIIFNLPRRADPVT